jgi:GGDEF domain-containing protein
VALAVACGLAASEPVGAAAAPPDASVSGAATPAATERLDREGPGGGVGRALIVDELAGAEQPEVVEVARAAGPGTAETAPEPAPGAAPGASPGIEIRDERREQGPAPWIAAIARQLERYERDGLPFALLLAELRDVERLRLETPPAELAAVQGALERVLAAELRGAERREPSPWTGSLTRQRPGRCWLLAPETDRRAARALADRLSRAVSWAVSHRAPPVEVLFGIAVCPQDGRQAATLAAHADIDLHAARSARG